MRNGHLSIVRDEGPEPYKVGDLIRVLPTYEGAPVLVGDVGEVLEVGLQIFPVRARIEGQEKTKLFLLDEIEPA